MERRKNQPAVNLRVQAVLQNKGTSPLNPARLAKMEKPMGWLIIQGEKIDTPKGGIKNKAGKGMEIFIGLSDKAIQRLREYLLALGWSAEQILDLLDYITKQ